MESSPRGVMEIAIAVYGLLAFGAFLAGLSRIMEWREFRRRRRQADRRERRGPRPEVAPPNPRSPVRLPEGGFHDDALPGGMIPGRAFLPAPKAMPEPTSTPPRRLGTAPFIRRREGGA